MALDNPLSMEAYEDIIHNGPGGLTMEIRSVTIVRDRIIIIHVDCGRSTLRAAIGGCLAADDRDTLFEILWRVEALAVQERANSEAWSKGFSEEAEEHALHHPVDEAIIEAAIANAEKKGD